MTNQKFDWVLAVAYNAMLTAGRAIMINKGYRPSSTEGHVAVMKFLQTTPKTETSQRMTTLMNRMRKKRHRIIYEDMDIVSKNEAQQAIKWAEEFVNTIEKTIRLETP